MGDLELIALGAGNEVKIDLCDNCCYIVFLCVFYLAVQWAHENHFIPFFFGVLVNNSATWIFSWYYSIIILFLSSRFMYFQCWIFAFGGLYAKGIAMSPVQLVFKRIWSVIEIYEMCRRKNYITIILIWKSLSYESKSYLYSDSL